MPSLNLQTARTLLGWTTLALGVLCIAVVGMGMNEGLSHTQARIVRTTKEYPWKSITAANVLSGAVIPADTHVVFHLPDTFTTISREVLLGLKGKQVRYWGYCFPANYDPRTVAKRSGFPGLIFLSEKERLVRAEQAALNKPRFSINGLPTTKEIMAAQEQNERPIRHQVDSFAASTMCYIMTEQSLSIGLDVDGDKLNTHLETELSTNPLMPDTDGDGITDGTEYLTATLPTIRDTDSDGLIDGIEDSDWDGRIDPGETDPRTKDSDRDTLCDGICRMKVKRQFIYAGEDTNLNGEVDDGETDPNDWDSDDDGISDEIEYLQCLASGAQQCP